MLHFYESRRFAHIHKPILRFPGVDLTKLFFFVDPLFFFFFAIKLDHFIVNSSFSFVTNTQAYKQKSENKEKQSLVGLTPGLKHCI